MSTKSQFDAFLNHSQADKPQVRRLAEQVQAAGLRFDEWIILFVRWLPAFIAAAIPVLATAQVSDVVPKAPDAVLEAVASPEEAERLRAIELLSKFGPMARNATPQLT